MATSHTILVIDDDENIRDDLQIVLEDHGYLVLTAKDGATGLKMARDDAPNLVILDMMMPRMSGFVVLEHLKEQGQRQLPVIMMTGNESDCQRSYAEFLGVDAYLYKPVRAGELMTHLLRLCPPPIAPRGYATPLPDGTV